MGPAHTADGREQIKTRDRVRELAEVYTHEREVKAMLDLIPDVFPSDTSGIDIKFLEPACGSGNFLAEILRRKLTPIRFAGIRSVPEYEHLILRASASIYAIDISAENVVEARDRMLAEVRAHYYNDANTIEPSTGFVSALRVILRTNVMPADFLADARRIEVIDYEPLSGGYFIRAWSVLDESVQAHTQPDLFHQEPEPKRDEVPVHYSALSITPNPTKADQPASKLMRSA